MDLSRQFFGAAAWTAVGRYGSYLFQLVVLIVLARLLDPSDFGLMGMVAVYTGFVNIFADAGIGPAIIQRPSISDRELGTLFLISTTLALALVSLTLAVSPLVESFFGFEGLSSAIRVSAIAFLFVAMNGIPDALLRRGLKFSRIALVNLVAALAGGVTGMILALGGAGYWALVYQFVVQNGVNSVLMMIASGWKPQFGFEFASTRDVLAFAAHVIGFSSINYWARSGDDLLVGRILGSRTLGFYTQGYRLMMMPQDAIIGIINPVVQPIFSRARTTVDQVRPAFLGIMDLCSMISFPAGALLAVCAHDVVAIVLGPGWQPVVPVLRWLGIVTAIQVPVAMTGPLLLGQGRSQLFFRLGLFSTLVYLSGFVLTVSGGIVMLAIGYLVSNLITAPVILYVTTREVLEGDVSEQFARLLKSALVAAVIAMIAFALQWALPASRPVIRLLVVGAVCGPIILWLIARHDQIAPLTRHLFRGNR